jgi:hypothetical protein
MKICKGCKAEKPLTEFYSHKLTLDGYRAKCKECGKKLTREYNNSPIGVARDKARRENPRRKEWLKQFSRKMALRHKNKRKINHVFYKWFVKNRGIKTNCEVCDSRIRVEAHHSDYNKPLEVLWLCSKHHKLWHRNNIAVQPQ